MSSWRQNLSYALRRLGKSRGFAAAAIISIGLGIAANSTIFSMVSAFVLHSAPVGDPSTLLSLSTVHRGNCCSEFSWPLYTDVRDQSKSFSGVAAYFPLLPASIGGKGDPERIWGQLVTSNFFDVAQLRMVLGRGFTSDEERLPVVILSHGVWQRRFSGDPDIIGKAVNISGRPFTVVGVTPPAFRGLDLALQSELWIPLGSTEQLLPREGNRDNRGHTWLMSVARLKPGVTREQANAEMSALGQRYSQAYPKTDKDLGFRLEQAGTLHPGFKSAVVMFLAALSVVVLLVLCIACANVANLLLAQASVRQREMAVRLALGATRGQLLRQMLTESVLLALAGGIFGVILSLWATKALSSFRLPIPIPIDFGVSVDWKVLLYTLIVSVGTGLLFGLAPALAASRPILAGALKGEDVLARPGRRWTLRNMLVVAQVAMSLILLCATGLFLRSLQSATVIDIGFRSHGLVTMAVDPQLHGYSAARTVQFLDTVRQRALALPGVASAAFVDTLPLSIGGTSTEYRVVGKPQSQNVGTDVYMVSPGYFDAIGIPMVAGRDFSNETATSAHVAVVNEAFVKQLMDRENPIGQRVTADGKKVYEIIGVVRNSKSRTLGESTLPILYRSITQDLDGEPSFLGYTLITRTNGLESASLSGTLRSEIRALDPNLAIYNAQSIEEHLRNALFLPRLAGTLFGIFGCVGLLLAAVGLYGVMSYSVSRRTREIGIRLALGAPAARVRSMVVRQGLVLTAIAMVLGLAAALAVAKLAAGILYGVQPHDLVTFTGVPLFLAAIAFFASWIPARRASKVDPMSALRWE